MESVLNISAHKHGNYHKYYEFHPVTARTSLMANSGMFLKLWRAQNEPSVFSLLDIGCNEGDLSVDVLKMAVSELPSHVKCILLGVDIDSSLIDLAINKYVSDETKQHTAFKAISFMDATSVSEYFSQYFAEQNISGFSFISMFSITMWIHLNHNDDGLKRFVSQGVSLLTSEGSILIEPQPWKCYKAANKRCRKLGMAKPLYYDVLKMRDIDTEIIQYLLKTEEFKLNPHYWCLGKEIWGRSLLVFHKSMSDELLTISSKVASGLIHVTDSADINKDDVTTATTTIAFTATAEEVSNENGEQVTKKVKL